MDAGVLGAGDVGTEAVADHGGAGGIAAELLEGDLAWGAGWGLPMPTSPETTMVWK